MTVRRVAAAHVSADVVDPIRRCAYKEQRSCVRQGSRRISYQVEAPKQVLFGGVEQVSRRGVTVVRSLTQEPSGDLDGRRPDVGLAVPARKRRPVDAGAVESSRMPRCGVDFHAVVRDPPVDASIRSTYRLDRFVSGEDENPRSVQIRLLDINGQALLGEFVNTVTEPLRVEIRTNPLAVIGDTQHNSTAARGIGEASQLVDELASCRVVLGRARQDRSTGAAAPGLLLAVDLKGLDIGRTRTIAQLSQRRLNLFGGRIGTQEFKRRSDSLPRLILYEPKV